MGNSLAYQNACWGLLLERFGIAAPDAPSPIGAEWVIESAEALQPREVEDQGSNDSGLDALAARFTREQDAFEESATMMVDY